LVRDPHPPPQILSGASPEHLGSLGIPISEAVEAAVTSNGMLKYSLGSVLKPASTHQTVIGLEAPKQFEMADEYPEASIQEAMRHLPEVESAS
jgi:tryptophan synthase beta chain